MAQKVYSCALNGLKCQIVEIEADISNGISSFCIVGLGDASVQESKERVRSGIKNSGATFPYTRKTINLAPAQIKKQGSHFDLPIAISILLATSQIRGDLLEGSVILGELSLTGEVKEISGTLPMIQQAKEQGFRKFFIPIKNSIEAGFIDDIEIYPISNLREFIKILNTPGDSRLKINKKNINDFFNESEKQFILFPQLAGLEKEKKALEISAAGAHNIFFNGPPGCGKTVLARSIKELLPKMSKEEMIECTKIYSVAGMLDEQNPIINTRPFREVHHTATRISIIGGGGTHLKPGEISLAHNGVLFFDEISEFPSNILDSMRQPLEDKTINISRSGFSVNFPAGFIFLACTNPCPCGHFGSDEKTKKCNCSDKIRKNYKNKISGPILDRFDLFLTVDKVNLKNIFDINHTEENLTIRLNRIESACEIQKMRFKNHKNINRNSDMTVKEIKEFCQLDKETIKILEQAYKNLKLSNRAYLKTIKVARTIADLSGREKIRLNDVLEALQYRIF